MKRTQATRAVSTGDAPDAIDFGNLFGLHAQAVYAFCVRRTADLALAEDLTSITFLEAWRHRERMLRSEDGSALPWLIGVANNVVRNARRGHRRYRSALERLPGPSNVLPAEDQALARSLTETRLREALAAISALPPREQDVVTMVLWTGLSYEETATALGIPLGTVQSRLSRARAKLQISLIETAQLVLKETL